MSTYNEYLSDEDLNKLINEIETEGETVAPYSIDEAVLSYVDKRCDKKKSKKISYYAYCMKVSVSIAAAIILMILLPYFKDTGAGVPTKKEVIAQEASISKEELFSGEVISSREEVLSENSEKDRLKEMQSIIQSKFEGLSE